MLRHRSVAFVLIALVAVGTAIAATSQGRAPAAADDPARVRIVNASRTEAVPVSIQELALPPGQHGVPMRVEIVGTPTVAIDPATPIPVRILSPKWEYKSIKIPHWDDAASQLNVEGAQGWETTGVMFTAPGGTTVVLKRQK